MLTAAKPYKNHLSSSDSLVTPYAARRAGFIAMALEKNRRATPYVEEAKALRVAAAKAKTPKGLLHLEGIRDSLLSAAGVSVKATSHLKEEDEILAILELIHKFLEPAGKDFVDELVYRFLLTKGDALGGALRNLAGELGTRRFSRAVISAILVSGRAFYWLHSKSKKWLKGVESDPDIEYAMRGLSWETDNNARTLVYNLTVPLVGKNVDFCLFDTRPNKIIFGRNRESHHHIPEKYIALGELKGGIDPAGADEHWKTANTALDRIRTSFASESLNPHTFFIGAAIENSMAAEIYNQLESNTLSNAANLTEDEQLISICNWLVNL